MLSLLKQTMIMLPVFFHFIGYTLCAPDASDTLSKRDSGTGFTSHYWDCCKPMCAWQNKAPVTAPVRQCNINDNWLPDDTPTVYPSSSCVDGTSYTCSEQQSWAVNDYVSFGFAAVNIPFKTPWETCCSCYELTFKATSGPLKDKKMIVQATNTGNDVVPGQFDIATPGGGIGQYNGCSKQWNFVPIGAAYGGYQNRWECDVLPDQWKVGCYWRFDWYGNAVDNLAVDWVETACPQAIADRSHCHR